MKKLPYQLIAVFTHKQEKALGNISALIELENWVSDEAMQAIARDLNQPATTFLRKHGDKATWEARWFAPDAEIGLCGHGTAAAVAYLGLKYGDANYTLLAGAHKLSGASRCAEHRFQISIDPIATTDKLPIEDALRKALGVEIVEHMKTGNKNIVLLRSEADLSFMNPQWHHLREMEHFGYAVTAPGEEVDFVSRTLVPFVQQLEDHATGSSHAALVPYWAKKLGKSSLSAMQLSPRKGVLECTLRDTQVMLAGRFEVLAEGGVWFRY